MTGGTQLAAVGTLGASKQDDYALSLTAGQTLSLALGYPAFAAGSTQAADLSLTLVGPYGTVLETGTTATEAAQSIADFAAATTGTYTVEVGGDAGRLMNSSRRGAWSFTPTRARPSRWAQAPLAASARRGRRAGRCACWSMAAGLRPRLRR